MSDIWSGVPVDINKKEGEYLYRVDGEVRGPVSRKVLVDRLLRGELPLDTQVAVEGGEFNPISRVASFADTVKKAKKEAAKRAARRTRRILALVLLCLAAVGGATAYFVDKEMKRREAVRLAKLAEAKKERERLEAELAKLERPELVALVSLGSAADVKIKHEDKSRSARKSRSGRHGVAPRVEQSVSQCERSQAEIVGVLSRHVPKINVCVLDEKKRDTEGLLPSTLPIDFVVRPDGKVVDFSIGHRAYKKGPLNNCMTKVFNGVRYPAAKGSNCPVTLPLKIGK